VPEPSAPPTGQTLREILEQVDRLRRDNQALFEEMARGERRYRGLAKAVWRVQEEERRRLARELHDGIGQTLTALKTQLEMILRQAPPGDGSGPRLRDSVELAARALDETRELSRLLRPPVLDDLGLLAALRWMVRRLEERTGLVVDLEARGVEDERLPVDLETLVFRVSQEALNNVLKHAGVERAQLSLERDARRLRLRIADRGAGFEPATQASESIGGLRGMRDRVELQGGRFTLRARPGAGTIIEAEIPLGGEEPETGTGGGE